MDRRFDLITFDFDGVLLHNDFNTLFLRVCREVGLEFAPEREPALARWIHDYYGSGRSQVDMEHHGREEFWRVANRRFLEALGAEPPPPDLDELSHMVTERIRLQDVVFFHETGVHELLARLRDDGYRIAMLTNRDENVHEVAGRWGLIEPFELVATRETVGKPKPEPDVFHHLSTYFDIAPARALHIGDNPYADARGALAAGWQPLLIDPDDLFDDWNVPRLRTLHELPGWLDGR